MISVSNNMLLSLPSENQAEFSERSKLFIFDKLGLFRKAERITSPSPESVFMQKRSNLTFVRAVDWVRIVVTNYATAMRLVSDNSFMLIISSLLSLLHFEASDCKTASSRVSEICFQCINFNSKRPTDGILGWLASRLISSLITTALDFSTNSNSSLAMRSSLAIRSYILNCVRPGCHFS